MDLFTTSDKLNLSAPEIGKSEKSNRNKNDFESILKIEKLLNCSTDTVLRNSKSASTTSKKKLSFLERQKLRFKLLEGIPQQITFSQDSKTPCNSTRSKSKHHSGNTSVDNKAAEKMSKDKDMYRHKINPMKEATKVHTSNSSLTFKVPESPPFKKKSQSKTGSSPVRSNDSKSGVNNNFDLAINNREIDFQTGHGKKIQLSKRAVKRASKIFDDVINLSPTDIADDSYQLEVNERKMKQELSNNSRTGKKNYAIVPEDAKKDNLSDMSSDDNPPFSDIEASQPDNSLSPSSLISKQNRSQRKEKNKSVESSPNNKMSNFTQVSESQMCWVADNAESLMEATDSQWTTENIIQSPVKTKKSTEIKTEILEDGFEDLSTQEAEFFGNMSFSTSNSQTSEGSIVVTKSQEKKPMLTQQDFRGFVNEEIDEAHNTSVLYKRTTNYIKNDVKTKKFFPINFIFEDVKLNMKQTNKIYRYSLRSSQGSRSSSPNYKVNRKKGKRMANSLTPQKKVVQNIKNYIKNKKYNKADMENNSFNESFTDEFEENCSLNYKELKSGSSSSLSSISTDKNSVSPETYKSTKTSKHVQENKEKDFDSRNNITIPEIIFEKIKVSCDDIDILNDKPSISVKQTILDDIFDAPTHKYIPPVSMGEDPDLFDDYDIFDEIITQTNSEKSSEQESQEIKRKNTSEDDLGYTARKRIKVSDEFKSDSNDLVMNIENNNMKESKNEVDFGFSTAAGMKIKISKESLKKAQNLFADCDTNIDENSESPEIEALEFSKAAGKKIHILDESLEKTKNILSGSNIEEVTESVKQVEIGSFGFSTAAGKKIQISEESLQKVTKLFSNCEENADERSSKSFGFSTAGGKKIQISEESLQKAKQLFTDCEENVDANDCSKNKENFSFSTAGGKKIGITEKSLQKVRNLFNENHEMDETSSGSKDNFSFSTAAGKKIQISEESLQKAKLMFNDCEENVTYSENRENCGLSTPGGNKIQISDQKIFTECEVILTDINYSENKENFGFSTAGCKKIQVSEESVKKAQKIFVDSEENLENREEFGFSTAGGTKIKISEESLNKGKELFSDCSLTQKKSETITSSPKLDNCNTSKNETKIIASNKRESNKFCRKLEETFSANTKVTETSLNTDNSEKTNTDEGENYMIEEKLIDRKTNNFPPLNNKTISLPQAAKESTPLSRNKLLKNSSSTKRLGMSSCREINISQNSIQKAKSIFEDIDSPGSSKSLNLNSSFGKYSSTPLKYTKQSRPRSLSFHTPQNRNSPNTTLTDSDLTMLTDTSITMQNTKDFKDQSLVEELSDNFSRFNFRSSQNNSVEEKKSNLLKEYELTKMKMSVIEIRLLMFEEQQQFLKNTPPEYKRVIPGHLYKLKTKTKRKITLKEAVKDTRPGKLTFQEALTSGIPPSVLEVTSENASKLNFFVPWWPNPHQTYPPVIQTEDKTTVIPNETNNVGLTEIKTAFLTTPGTDAKLLPQGWIENHFRWIVWKLASMERSFLNEFTNCLSVENVIAQLKYRYDREIDRAQRPAIRKILERDDIPRRRLVLCVAAILKLPDRKFELELTDGWYSIKTSIDAPLNNFVESGVIKPGIKLMLHGAELSNCEACHPLDIPPTARLQIHYNSTRRAAWHVKLGYQRDPGPFCISLKTINNNGGPVSCTSAYVARVYPINYMERLENTVIWRNKKAEQRNATEWETKQTEVMERLQQRVQQELENEWIEETRKQKMNYFRPKDIKTLTCPKTLYQILETSNDPESIKDMMTPSQCYVVQEYQSKLATLRQDEVSARFAEILSKENIKKRDVCSVLKLLLVDVNSQYHTKILSIWRPKDTHFQELKEGNVVRMFNIAVKNNGSLSSTPRTQFEVDLNADTTIFEHMERSVTLISETLTPKFNAVFGEFDTVGMVVYMDFQKYSQTVWFVDENSSFLMVRVAEGPETCLLDGVSVGKILSVTNLIFQKCTKLYAESTANHYTTFSSYPQQTYLQYFLKSFIEQIPDDIDKYLDECKDHVEVFLAQNALRANLLNMNSLSQVDDLKNKICGISTMTTDVDTLTLSDEELSSFDTQDYLLG